MADQYYEGVGRRKRATARVRIYPGGEGKFIVNEKPVEVYFPREGDLRHMRQPLVALGVEGSFDITVKVNGGGVTGQAGAVQLGLSRALVKFDEENRRKLREYPGELLTRDPREKERKKPGLKRARKAPTYTKR